MAAGDSFTQFEFELPVALPARQRHVLTELEVFGDRGQIVWGWA
jgi:hypothetical protein